MASKNTPDAIISGAGWLTQFAAFAIPTLRARGMSDEEIHRLGTPAGAEDMARGVEAYCDALAGKIVNPQEFFVTRLGLYAWPEFTERILAVAKPATASNVKLGTYNLPVNMNDAEIRPKLGEGHVFEDASVFSATLAKMIDAQANGEDGDLLANGYANIFYVRGLNGEVFAVSAYWNSLDRRWVVRAGRLVGSRWFAGRRAFSATAVA